MSLHAVQSANVHRHPRIPALETARLVLRAPRLSDAAAITALANDRRVAENTTCIPHPYTRADAKEWLSICNRCDGEATFLMTVGGDRVIGAVGLGMVEEGAPEVGYWLGTPYWRQGFATEAVRALIDYAFSDLECSSLQAGARVANPASRRVLEKCGFQWFAVGLYRVEALGCSAPIDRFRLDRAIWTSLKNWGPTRKVA